jgi:hypothetical protein
MPTTVTLIEGEGGKDDTIKVEKDGVETIFESVDDAARYVGVGTDQLESALDDAGYDEPVDPDDLPDPEDEDESDEGSAA